MESIVEDQPVATESTPEMRTSRTKLSRTSLRLNLLLRVCLLLRMWLSEPREVQVVTVLDSVGVTVS